MPLEARMNIMASKLTREALQEIATEQMVSHVISI